MLHVAAMFRRTFGASRYMFKMDTMTQLSAVVSKIFQLSAVLPAKWPSWPSCLLFFFFPIWPPFPSCQIFWTKNRRHDPAVSCCVSKNVSDVAADSCCVSKNVLNVAAVSCCVLKNFLLVAAVSCCLQYGGGHVDNFLVMQLLCTV